MAIPLTVRNLTPNTISIIRVERFEDVNTLQTKVGGHVFGARNTTSAAPTAPKLGEHAESFTHQDLTLVLAPFESCILGSSQAAADSDDLLPTNTTSRLTIKTTHGECYRVDTHPAYTQKSSRVFVPLSQNPSTSYTALFHPSRPTPHVTIHINNVYEYHRWMASVPDTFPLSALSIPGTHNSHTKYRALPSVRCQIHDVRTQLQNGIRFLDIRVQPVHATDATKKDLYLVHGAFPVSLTGPKYFDPVLQACYDFLEDNPSETVLISLKREGIGSATDEHLAQILNKHYIEPHASIWYTDTKLPYLGAVRGKLVLVRRYNTPPSSKPTGLDATAWPNNASHALFPSPISTFCLQDFCEVLEPSIISTKIQYSNEHLVRAAECIHHIPGITTDLQNPVPPGPLYLNFLSGSNFWKRACWPENIAKIMNKGMEEWLCAGHHLQDPETTPRHPDQQGGDVSVDAKDAVVRRARSGDGSTGVVVMDYVGENGDWDLVRLIVGMNMGVLMKMQEKT
jgi:1-phosphatidylinositol phosphodiesterase